MGSQKVYRAIGLMSGTSLDGVDAALLETDGHDFVHPVGFYTCAYEDNAREVIRARFGQRSAPAEVEKLVTDRHIEAVRALAAQENCSLKDIDVIGFHGQTITHNPAERVTVQIGDALSMAQELGVKVVADFRSSDVKAGGQGAPFLPLYHAARVKAAGLKLPVAIVNIGGVANVTYIDEDEILAFDTGPGNALMDDWALHKTRQPYDAGGLLAQKGEPDGRIIDRFFTDPFFKLKPPKSLDRDHWTIGLVKDLSAEDGMATLMAMTTGGLERAFRHFPRKVKGVYVSGGGRKNDFLMHVLRQRLPMAFFAKFQPVDRLGWNGDAIEAEGFAYLAVRSLLGEPLSLPSTTGVPEPMTGGILFKP